MTYEYVSPSNMAYVGAVLALIDSVVLVAGLQLGAKIYPNTFLLGAAIYVVMLVLLGGLKLEDVPMFDSEDDEGESRESGERRESETV
jgi:hypothetical protein